MAVKISNGKHHIDNKTLKIKKEKGDALCVSCLVLCINHLVNFH